ncbi:LOW QUALITY PROTEIN: hypothetical protein V1477_006455 [Vespula maculifrons]|uniref:Uncharacterized protein n=1 Tax=Vespula maculifrons TaxID=7453 RepID=A0ABD2CJM2_VESMC
MTHLGEPDWGHWKELVAPSTPIFSSTRSDNIGKKHFSLTIFFSETIAPRRTGPGSFERARRTLYAHIFCVQIGPIGAEEQRKKKFSFTIFFYGTVAPRRTRPESLERARRALYAHIFFVQIEPIGADTEENRTGDHLGEPDWSRLKELVAPSTPMFFAYSSDQYEPSYNRKKYFSLTIFFSETIAPTRTGLGSLERARRALYAHIFFVHIGPIGAEGNKGKKNFPLQFFSPKLKHLGEPDWGHWKVRVAPSTLIFSSTRSVQKGKKHFSLTIFFSETIAPTRTVLGSLERSRRSLYAHIFCVQIGPIGAEISLSETIALMRTERGSLERARHALYAHIFFIQIGPIEAEIFSSETIAPRRTGPGSYERARRTLYAHIFCVQIGPIRAERTRPGSLERARRALYAHIFFVLIEPIGADTYENRSRVSGKGPLRPLRPYFLRTDRTNRSRFKGNKGKKHCSLRIFLSETIAPRRTGPGSIFLSETIAPRRTGPGSSERAHRALYAHIFLVQIGPIGAKRTRLGLLERARRALYAHIFLVQIGPIGAKRTGPGSFERGRRALHAHIFCVQGLYDLGEPGWGHWKGLVAPSTPIFSSTRSNIGKKHFSLTIIFSETIAPRRTGPGSFERARRTLYAHIFCVQIGPIGAEEQRKKKFSFTIFFYGTVAPRRTRPGSLERARRALYAHIFFVQIEPIGADTEENRTGVHPREPDSGHWEGSSRPLRTYFFRPYRTNRSRVITLLREPDPGHWKGLVAASTPIFSSYRSDQSEPSYNAPTRTVLGSLERSRRALYAHIFCVQIGPIGAEISLSETIAPRRTEPGPFERARRALYAHISFVQIEPIGAEIFLSETVARTRTGAVYLERARCALYAHIFCVQTGPIGAEIFLSETIAPRRTGPGSSERAHRALYAHIFLVQIGPIGAKNFSFKIFFSGTIAPRRTGPGSFERARRALYAHISFVQIGPIGAEIFFSETIENGTLIIGKDSSRPIRPYFFRSDRTNRSRAITGLYDLGEPGWGHWKGLVAPSTPIFSSTRSVQNTYENRIRVTGKGSSRPLRPYFLRTGRTNRSRFKGNKGKKHCALRISSSETIAPRRTGPGSFERARRTLYAHIFCVQTGPIGAEIFLSETIAPRRTGPGSSERAHRALYAHIFLVQIGPIGANTYENGTLIIGKDSSRPLRPYFFRPDRSNRSRAITHLGEPDRGRTIRPRRTRLGSLESARRVLYAHIFFDQIGPKHRGEPDRGRLKGLVAPSTPIFFSSRSHLGEPDWSRLKEFVAPSTPMFFAYSSDQYEPSYNRKKHFSLTIFFSETIAPTRTGLGSLERARRALYAHIFFVHIGPIGAEGNKGKKNFSLQFFSPKLKHLGEPDWGHWKLIREPDPGHWKGLVAASTPIFSSYRSDQSEPSYNAPTRTVLGSLESSRRALYAHIFCVQIGPIGAEISLSETIAPMRTERGSLERARHALYAHIFFIQIGPIEAEIFSSETIAPRRTGPGSFERARTALYAHISFVQIEPIGAEGKKHCSLRIFLSETVARTRTGAVYLERARCALYAHIFCVQTGPIGAEIFLSETIAPRGTGPGSFERARRALYAHIFFENGTLIIGKDSSRPIRPYFFRSDRTNRSRAITDLGEPDWGRTIRPRRTRLGSLERARRALYAHIFFDQIGPKVADTYENRTRITGEGSSRPLRTYFFRSYRTKSSRVITHLREPDPGHWKGLVAASTPIFSSYRSDQSEPSYNGNKGKKNFSLTTFFSGTIRPRRTGPGSFERTRCALYAYIFFDQIGPKVAEERKHFSLTIFFSETIAPTRTVLGSLERSRRALYAHIFCVQIGPIGAEISLSETIAPRRTGPGSFERTRRALYTLISFVQIGPIGAEIFFSETIENGTLIIGKDSSRPLRPYFFRPDRTNRSRAVTHLGEPDRGRTIRPRRTRLGSLERARRALYAHIFCVQVRPIGAKRTGLGSFERARRALYDHIFGVQVRPIGAEIFFSGTKAPRRTRLGSLESARRALYAHIFCVQIGPIGAEIFLSETIAPRRTGLGSFERARGALYAHIFFHQGEPYRGPRTRTGVGYLERARRALYAHIFCVQIGPIGAEIFLSETIAPRRTGPGSFERARRALYAHIFFNFFSETIARRRTGPRSFERARRSLYAHIFVVQIGPIGAELLRFKGDKGKRNFSFTIFFSGTIAPRRIGPRSLEGLLAPSTRIFLSRTVPGSFERARRVLYAHIFCVHIGPIGAERTRLGSLERARRALYDRIFFDQIGPKVADTYENRTRVTGKGSSRPLRPYFLRTDRTNRSRVIMHVGEPDWGHCKVLVAPSTHLREPDPGHWKGLVAASTPIFSSTRSDQNTYENRTRVTGKGSSRPLRPYFLRTDRTNRSRVITHLGEPDLDHWKGLVAPSTPIFLSSRSDQQQPSYNSLKTTKEKTFFFNNFFLRNWNKGKKNFPLTIFFSGTKAPRRTSLGSLESDRRALYAHIFFDQIGPKVADTYENRSRVSGKGSSRPLRPYFLRTDRTNRSRVITHLGEPDRGRLKGLVAPSTPIFLSSRSDQQQPSYNRNKGKKNFSLTIFFSGTKAPRRTRLGSLESARRALCAHIFFDQIGPKNIGKKHFSLTILFSETVARTRTGAGYLERARRSLYAHIFCVQIGPIGAEIFLSETIAPRRTGPGSIAPRRTGLGSFERGRRALHAHIFCVQGLYDLGEPGWGHWKGLVAPSTPIFSSTRSHLREPFSVPWKGLVAPSTPIFLRTGPTNRSRVITGLYDLGEPGWGNKGKKNFSLTIFFSGTKAPRRTRLGSLESARRALYAHIFCVQIGPIGAEIFLSETIAPRRTGPGSFERARGALYAHIFFFKDNKGKKHFSLTIFFSGTIAPRRTVPGSFERARRVLYAHIFCVHIGPIGAERTRLGSLESARRALYVHIFFDQIGPKVADTYENRSRVSGKGSSRPLRPYFLRTDRTNRGRVITHLGEPDRDRIFFSETIARRRTGPGSFERARRALYAHIFVVQIGPIGAERTVPGSFERARRVLYAHIFCVQIGPIGAERTRLGSLERARRALYGHIFFDQIGPKHLGEPDLDHWKGLVAPSTPIFLSSRSDQQQPSYNRNKGKKNFPLTIFFSGTKAPRRTSLGSLESARRALYAHIFFDQIGPKVADTYENRSRVSGKGSSRPLRPYFLRTDRTNRSRVITHLGEPDRGRLKGLVAPSTPIFLSSRSDQQQPSYNKFFSPELKHLGEPDWGHWKVLVAPSALIFSSTRSDQKIFLSETIAPRRTGPRSFERACRALYAHISFNKGKKNFSLTIFFSETVARTRTGAGYLERARRSLYAHIFCVQIGPIGAEIFLSETIAPRRTGPRSFERACRALYAHISFFKDNKGKKHFSLTIFFSETVSPSRTGPGSFERARRALYAHIFCVQVRPIAAERTSLGSLESARRALYAHIFFDQIGPKVADTYENRSRVSGKGSSRPLRPYFLRTDRTNRSRVITYLGEPDRGRLKGLVAPSTPIFLSSRSDQQQPSYNRNKGKKNFSLTIFFSGTKAPRRTRLGSLESARRALCAHIFFDQIGPKNIGKKHFSLTILFSETVARTRTGAGYLERARRSLYAHIFCVQIGPIGAEIFLSETIAPRRTGPGSIAPRRTGLGSFERGRRALHAHIFCVQGLYDLGEPGWGHWKGLVAPSTPIFSSTRSHLREPFSVPWKGLVAPSTPIFLRTGPTNRSRVITGLYDLGEPGWGNKGKKNFSLTIFFSGTKAPRRTRLGSLESARRALYAHIFCVQIGPIGAEIFLSETIAPRRTGPGSFERARGALYAHIFFFKDNKGKKHFSLTIFFSGTIAPRRTVPGSFERARRVLYAHIFCVHIGPIGAERTRLGSLESARRALYVHIFFDQIGPKVADTYENRSRVSGKGSSRPLRPYFLRTDRTNRGRVITHLGEPDRDGIFFSETIARRRTGPGSFERARRALYAHIFVVQIGPIGAERTVPGSFERARRVLYAHIFCVQIGPIGAERTRLGSLERARRALYGHIFFDQIGPKHLGEPDLDHWKGLVAPSTPIFLSSRSDQQQPSYNRNKGKKNFPLTIFFSGTKAPRRTSLGSLESARRALYAHIFFDQIGPKVADTYENRSRVSGKGSSRPLRPYFLRTDRTNRSRVITHLGEPDRGRLKGLVAPSTPIFLSSRSDQQQPSYNNNKGKKHFSLTIFFSETVSPRRIRLGSLESARRALYAHIFFDHSGPKVAEIFFSGTKAPRRTRLGSLESARRALCAHIFFDQIGPKVAEIFLSETIAPRRTGPRSTYENRSRVSGKSSSLPLRPYFLRTDRTNRSRVITHLGEPDRGRKGHFSLTILFSETVARTRTGAGYLERARRSLYAHIFCVQIGPIGAEIFLSETIAPRRTGPGAFERARRVLYAHIFCVQIGPTGAERTRLGSLQSARRALYDHIFFVQIRPIEAERTGLGLFERARRALYAHIFGVQVRPIGAEIFFSGTKAPRRTRLGSLESARRALYAHILFDQIGPLVAERTGLGSFERARRALYAHIFGVQVRPIGAEIFFSGTKAPRRTRLGSLESARRALYAHIFCVQIGPIGAEIFLSKTIAPRRTGPGSFERARRALNAHIFVFKDNKGKKHFSLTIFFSETVSPKPDRGRLKELVAPSTPIFLSSRSDQQQPSYNRNKGKKNFPLTIFFSGTKAPRRTSLGSLESARRALYAHIFFDQIGPKVADTYENRSRVSGKGSSRPLRPYFLRTDRTNRSRVITHLGEPDRGRLKGLVAPSTPIFLSSRSDQQQPSYNNNKGKKHFSLTIFFSETVSPRRIRLGSLESARRALYAHIFFDHIGPKVAERTGPGSFERARRALYAHIFVHLGEPDRGRLKGLVAPSTPIFLSSRSDQKKKTFFFNNFVLRNCSTYENRSRVSGKSSSLPLRPYFLRTDRTNRSRHLGEPDRGRKGHFSLTILFSETVARTRTGAGYLERARRSLYAHIFCVQIGPIGAEIFLSETIAPRRTGPGAFERARRVLYAHIFCVQIGPTGAERTRLGSLQSARRALYAHIFFVQIRPIEAERTGLGSFERARRALYAHIFGVQVRPIGAEIFFSGTKAPRRTRLGSLESARRALYAHILFDQIGPLVADTYENRIRVTGKGSSRPLRSFFLRPDRTRSIRVITFKDNKGKKHFSLTIFFSETIAPRRTGPGSFERARRVLYAHIFCVQIGPIGAERTRPGSLESARRALYAHIFFDQIGPKVADTYENRSRASGKGSSRPLRPYFLRTDRTNRGRFKGNKGKKHCSLRIFLSETIAPRRTGPGSFERARRGLYAHIFFVQNIGKKHFSITIFFSETIAPTRTVLGSLERARRALYAHIFCVQIGPIGAEGQRKKNFSLTTFFSGTIRPRRTRLGSLERARRALYAHIFFDQIGPKVADTYENRTRVTGKGSSRPLRPYFLRTDRTNRSRVITFKDNKGKKHFSLTIFFSGTKAPRRTRLGSLESARRALYAHIFCVQIGPIGAHLGEPDRGHNKGKKHFSLTIFFSETIAPRRTVPGSFERARRALYAHIFFDQIGPKVADTYENRSRVSGKGSSRPLRPYFLRTDRTNRGQHVGEPDWGHCKVLVAPSTVIFSSTRSDQKYPSYNENIGKKHFSLTIFFSGTKAPTRTGSGSLERARRGLYGHFFFDQIGPEVSDTYENRIRVTGKGSSRPLRPYFLRPDRTNRSRVITHVGEPDWGHCKVLVAPSPFKDNKGKKHFSLTIFFSETIAPRRTGPGSFKRARRVLYAHIFCVQNGPIGAERTRPGSLESARRALYAHIFFDQIGPKVADTYENRSRVSGKGSSRPLRPYFLRTDRTNRGRFKGNKGKKHCSLRIFLSETIAPRRTGPGSFERARRGLYAHIFFVQENHTGVFGKGSSRPLQPNFLRPDRSKSSRVITNIGKKHFSITIFFSETIAPTRTVLGSLERARRALYAHIFCVQIGPIGADTYENRTLIIGKDSSRPLRPYFFRPDRTNSSRAITHLGEPDWGRPTNRSRVITVYREQRKRKFSLTIFFSGIKPPRRTRLGSLERARRALYAHIFSDQIGPKVAERTGPESMERARRALYAHIFCVQGRPIGADKAPRRTRLGSFERARRALYAHIFFFKDNKGKKHFSLTIFFSKTIARTRTGAGYLERARLALYAHIFCVQIGPIGAEIFLSETIARRRTGPGSFERARRALYAHIFLVQIGPKVAEIFLSKTIAPRRTGPGSIFLSETIAPRRTGPGSFERARRALYAHMFLVQIESIGADTEENQTGVIGKCSSRPLRSYFLRPDRTKTPTRTGPRSLERARRGLYAHIFFVQIGPIGAEIFLSETIAPRRTERGSLERARRALYAHIFCVRIGPIGANTYENRSRVSGKGSLRPLRPYFLRRYRPNRSRVITFKDNKGKKHFSLTIFFSETISPRRTGPGWFESARRALYAHIFWNKGKENFPLTIFFSGTKAPRRTRLGSLERARRALYAHIFSDQIGPKENWTGVHGKSSSRPLRPYFLRTGTTNTSRVITHVGEPDWGHCKVLVAPSTVIFSSTRSDQNTYENRIRVTGKGSSRPLRPYFLRPDRTNRSRVITHVGEPDWGHCKVLVAPSPFKDNKGKKHFSLTIFFSETIAPRRTGPGSFERARRVLYAHIFCVQIGPIGAERTRPGSLESARRALYAHIFFDQIGPKVADTYENRSRVSGKGSSRPLRPYFLRTDRTNRGRFKGNKGKKYCSLRIFLSETIAPRRTGPGSFERARRGLYAHIFFVQVGPIGAERTRLGSLGRARRDLYNRIFFDQIGPKVADTYENRTRVTGKGSSRPLRPYFLRPDRSKSSRVITHLREPYSGHWKGLVAPSTPIFFAYRSDQQQPSYNRNKGKENFPLTIFFSGIKPPRRTRLGSLERARRALYAHIFSDQIGPKFKDNKGKKHFSLTIFFSKTIARTRTGAGYLERARLALYAHIFCVQIGPIGAEIFLSETIARRRTGPGSFERARRALYAHIFLVQIGPKVAEIFLSKTIAPRRTGPGSIFLSETIAPRRTGPGSFERARRALYAHMFLVQIEPIGADTEENQTGVIGKCSSRPLRSYFLRPDRTKTPTRTGPGSLERARRGLYAHIFFVQIGPIGAEIFLSETIAPRRTERGSFERARRALYAHIFCVRIGPIGAKEQTRTRTGAGYLERARCALYAHIFCVDIGPIGAEIFLSETIAPRRTGPGSFERARRGLYAHIFFVQVGPIGADTYENRTRVTGKGSSRPLRPYFLRTDRTNRSRVIMENQTGVFGKGSSRPLRPYFLRPDRSKSSRVITHLREPYSGHWKGLVAPSTPIFFAYRSDQQQPSYNRNKGKENFPLTIFFSGIKPPRRTRLGSLERARRALYAHIFSDQIGPKVAERTGPGSMERARRALYAHIFCVQGRPIGADKAPRRTRLGSFERARRALYAHIFFFKDNKGKKHFSLTIFFSKTIARTRTGAGYLERARLALYAHIFCVQIGPIGAEIFLSETIARRRTGPGSFERARRALYAHIFLVQIGPKVAEIFLSKTIAPRRTGPGSIFLSETIAPRRTGPGSFERARRALYAHMFLVQIEPIGADTEENQTGVIGKCSSRPLRSYFLRPDRTKTPTRTGPGSLERARRGLYAHIFFVQIGPIGAEIFLSETIAPRRTERGSFERARRALYAHIFCVRIGPIGANTYENRSRVSGKGSLRPLRPYFLRRYRPNRSRVITHLGEPDLDHWKGLVALSTPIFLSSRSDQ